MVEFTASHRLATTVCLVIVLWSSAGLRGAQTAVAEEAPPADVQQLLKDTVSNINKFGFELLDVLDNSAAGAHGKNTFYSPLSVSTSLGVLAQGATPSSDTLKQISRAFGGTQVKGDYEQSEGAAFPFVLNDAAGHVKPNDPLVDIHMANSAWFDGRLNIEEEYKEAIRLQYGAQVKPLSDGEDINRWVDRKTEGLISEVVPPGPVNAAGIVVNTIYFKGAWQKPFDKRLTREGIFYTPNGRFTAQMMSSKSGSAPYEKEAVIVSANLPTGQGTETMETKVVEYDFGENEEYSAVIVMPNLTEEEKKSMTDTRKLDLMIDQLAAQPAHWDTWMELLSVKRLANKEALLRMPRFKVEAEEDLVEALAALGIRAPFQRKPGQLTDISNDPQLFVDQMKHKAVLDLDEEGAEAAAATSFRLVPLSFRGGPEVVEVDSPFLFFIRNKRTGLVLFAGKIVHPQFT